MREAEPSEEQREAIASARRIAREHVTEESSSSRRKVTHSGAKLIVTAVAASCVGLLVVLPKPVAPRGLPRLHLDLDAVETVVASRRARRDHPATRSAAFSQLQRLFRAQGRAEVVADSESALSVRQQRIGNAVRALVQQHGDAGIEAFKAWALGELERSSEGALNSHEERAILGSFPRVLERYGAADDEGYLFAGDFVVTTIYEARCNAILGYPSTAGFERVERQAYYGWLALHAERAAPELRAGALRAFAEAGGAHATEAAAVMAFRAGAAGRAAALFHRAYEASGELRLRNHALAAQHHL